MRNNNDKPIQDEAEETNEQEQTEDAHDKELEELAQKVEEFETKYKRALADYQNLEKRVSEQRLDLIKGANRDLLLRLLPILDTLVLANQHVQNEGLQVSINQFFDTLKSEGAIRIETVGQDFDPATMEVIAVDEGDENKVLEELRAGFLLHDKLLRAAQVKVGKGK
jgi:molecular chaperone GrpE